MNNADYILPFKFIVLFYRINIWFFLTSDTKELRDTEKVESIRERYIATLCTYVQKTYPNDEQRLGNLLLRLGPLKSIALQVLEHLFFFKILGDIPIDTFLLEMLDSDNH